MQYVIGVAKYSCELDIAYVFKAMPYRLREGGALAPRRRLGAQSGRFSKAEGERFDA